MVFFHFHGYLCDSLLVWFCSQSGQLRQFTVNRGNVGRRGIKPALSIIQPDKGAGIGFFFNLFKSTHFYAYQRPINPFDTHV